MLGGDSGKSALAQGIGAGAGRAEVGGGPSGPAGPGATGRRADAGGAAPAPEGSQKIAGPRHVIPFGSSRYPQALVETPDPPACLYLIGDPAALRDGLAVIGARRATPYGIACAKRFAGQAAERGICIVSGGAYGCDSAAHEAALDSGGTTVVFLGGGCDRIYPARHFRLFQRIVDGGGALVSEHSWDYPPLPHSFRRRNRLIAGLARATLIVEAGLPSGTFSTADEALLAGREVFVVPGAITSGNSAGSNRLLYQGASPIVDDESFEDALFSVFGCLKMQRPGGKGVSAFSDRDPLLEALCAQPMRMDSIMEEVRAPSGAGDSRLWITLHLAELERDGLVVHYPDGRYGCASGPAR